MALSNKSEIKYSVIFYLSFSQLIMGQSKYKVGAVFFRFIPNISTMFLYDFLDQVETKAGSMAISIIALAYPAEFRK